ncbi:MAG TPA: chemotaxis protein CheW, partial [Polyangia bacterium]
MRGVINLRGSVVPVIDLRLKLGLSRTETTVNTCVVIAEVDIDHEKTVLGVLVDSVQEVIDLEAGQVAPPPRMGAHIDSDVIRGMGKREDQFIILLDIDRILTSTEIQTASALSAVESGDQATP